ncbi:hypothetical protein CcaverHIS002_0305240 [Cutaneotrichosporon cavernicola]|uniref:WD40 repeat-like protein n=1 Tax=Cutaneotrichosporon cavernicola TaxID=279322 RepID=A0AA48IFF0_9TREE|nr:uncharacterized protein CcaverHIS019_0305210 [Cutaneotrichosporon cavernicola]BEI82656.1 hypothetical protein CcaverHIS002_0305240 [Cutaneotrichosporon cavernicola]BEI90451.1 hypothetical protein CcaverHIS019_0305210 [Cutaneotrichosporon cavernicola]BEI98225.1 hypothetical protein CcaverHIS631_0305240 [Cutaneotrichosporon cavernicola]BEJ06001.1 hypothetical protein CcaverHIS641_0305230 [Cutaneotrichosporon cavernicola]
MQLGRYSVSTLRPAPILGIAFGHDGKVFAVATETGYEVWRTFPLGLLRRKSLPGMLARAVPLPGSPLLALQGGGSDPLFPPNKVVLYHDVRGAAVADLEFSERVRGIAVRHRTVVVVLLRRAIAYEYSLESGFKLTKLGEWETADNEAGLIALATAPGATLLALPGRQAGHVHLINLPPCGGASAPPAAFRSPFLLAHAHPLSALACSASGAHLLTASERGTLVRVWDTARGAQDSELRRGVDRAEIWGLQFEDAIDLRPLDGDRRRDALRRKGGRVVGWSDKGTVHVWAGGDAPIKPKAQPMLGLMVGKALSLSKSLPNYFSSAPSIAQYYLPRKNPHAFASTIGSAVDAAGLPSMKLNEDGDKEPEEREWAEHYIVVWIEVDVEDDEDEPPLTTISGAPTSFRPKRSALTMGSREERSSFGSEGTSTRTATPRGGRSATPTAATVSSALARERRSPTGSGRRSNASTPMAQSRASPVPPISWRKASTDSHSTVVLRRTHRERQLVVVTHSGDWYRLRLPRNTDEFDASTKAELVEYRRLGVGGGGW